MPDFNQLRDRPLFIGIDRDAFNKFSEIATYREYRPGEVIIREGEQKDALLVIEKGQVEVLKGVHRQNTEGQPIAKIAGSNKYYDLYQGDILGEMSLIDVEPASASVKAVTEVGIWSIDRMDFAAILRKDLETYIMIITNIARILSRRLRDTNKKLI